MHRLAHAAATLLVLGACAPLDEGAFYPVDVPPKIEVVETPTTVELPAALAVAPLPLAERIRAAAFADAFRSRGSGPLTIAVGGVTAAEAARIGGELAEVARTRGVPPGSIDVAYLGAVEPTVRMTYAELTALAPACAPEAAIAFRPFNRLAPAFGCARQRNLAAMVANPADLIGPASMPPADAERMTSVVRAYRLGESTRAADSEAVEAEIVTNVGE